MKNAMKTSVTRVLSVVSLGLLASLLLALETSARVFVPTNSTWRYFKGTSEASDPISAWRQLEFDDSAWLVGPAPFHFGTNVLGGDDDLIGGTLLSDMRSNYTCLFLRQQFGLLTDGSADATDPDTDGHNTWQEWRCQTCPTNALSVLHLLPTWPDGTNVTVTWQSVAGVSYFLECSTNLAGIPRFTTLANGIPGQSGTTSYADTNAVGTGPFFHRVGVGN
jgi:hypothetical protein